MILDIFKQHVSKIDYVLGVGHFGSSQFSSSYNDIDIILITNEIHSKIDIATVDKLYYNYEKGIQKSISTTDNFIIKKLEPFLDITKYQLDFVFGPNYNIRFKDKIVIHIKGPISHSVFQYFVDKFPFHGTSILNKIDWLYKSSFFDFKHPKIKICDYEFHANVLYKRMQNCSDKFKAIKLIKKLILNSDIAYNEFKNTLTTEIFKDLEIIISSDVYNQKEYDYLFNKLYREQLKMLKKKKKHVTGDKVSRLAIATPAAYRQTVVGH
ncbi:hypothetical protein [Lutibacter sp.]